MRLMHSVFYKSAIDLRLKGLLFLAVVIAGSGCSTNSSKTQNPSPLSMINSSPQKTISSTKTVMPSATSETSLLFAVIGDYGLAGDALQGVANMVIGWSPDLIITTGDNNYPDGASSTIDENIGQYYHEFIAPYLGSYGSGAETNRFFPALGNHDWTTDHAQAYLDYFTLPGNERYYDFIRNDVHFFILDSDTREPDGVGRSSVQAQWLQTSLAASPSPWKVVISHYPPYSSGYHGSTDWMAWPFKQWGASVVLSGHDHDYERLLVDDLPYLVNGLSGSVFYNFSTLIPGSQSRHAYDFCAIQADATSKTLSFKLICKPDTLIDSLFLQKPDQ